MFAFFGLFEYLIRVLPSAFFSCALISFLATVFRSAYAFNGDINQWDVAKVTTFYESKRIRIAENDLTRLNSCYCVIGGFHRGFRVGGDDVT